MNNFKNHNSISQLIQLNKHNLSLTKHNALVFYANETEVPLLQLSHTSTKIVECIYFTSTEQVSSSRNKKNKFDSVVCSASDKITLYQTKRLIPG